MSRKVLVSLLQTIEVALVGLFFVQALRRLPGLLLNRSASASLFEAQATGNAAVPQGMVDPTRFSGEIVFLLLMLALPLLARWFSQDRRALPVSVVFIAVARALPALGIGLNESHVSSAVLGGGLVFIVLIMHRRVMQFPQLMILGFAADQLLRAASNTLDPSWSAAFAGPQLLLSAAAIAITVYLMRRAQEPVLAEVTAQRGLMTLRGALGLGALLYLELTLLALPNAIAARTATPLNYIAPLIIAATLLPLLPPVRSLARSLLQAFYGGLRGWLWLALIALLLVVGLRLEGLPAAIALVLLQFAVSLMWWWLLRPQEEGDRNLAAVVLIPALLVTALLLLGNYFTVAVPLAASPFPALAEAGELAQSMLRGLRGMGAALLLLAVILAALPMTRTRHRIAWANDSGGNSLPAFLFVLAATVLTVGLSNPPPPDDSLDASTLRVATWNIDAGANIHWQRELEPYAQTILASGADVVLLQNVDAGRSTSFWVDQAYWLARRLNMQHRFYPTAEGVNGLALLSRAELGDHNGWLAVGDGQQGGLQRASLNVQGETLTLYNYWPGQAPRSLQLQIGAMNTLIGALHIRQEPELLVLGASFDESPDDQLLLPLRAADFNDPFYGHPLDSIWTTTDEGEEVRTDFLWLRAPLRELGTGVLAAEASGHRLAMFELSLSTGPG